MDKLRVGVVLNENYSPEIGGGFSYYSTLINAIDNNEFDSLLEFVFVQFDGSRLNEFKKKYINFNSEVSINEAASLNARIKFSKLVPILFLRNRLKKRYSNRLASLRKKNIEDWLISNEIDLLYHLFPEGGYYNYPFVTTHWDIGHLSTYRFPELSMGRTFSIREKRFNDDIKRAFAIFCESESGKKELMMYNGFGDKNIFIIPLFPSSIVNLKVDEETQSVLIRNQFGLNKSEFFLYPAQFWAHKNHYTLVNAFRYVIARHPTCKLILPGSDHGNLSYIKDVVNGLGLKDNVIFPGFVTNEALYSLYKNAKALVMPTLLGPTNMPLLEAMMLGCRVITSDFPGHRELLKDNAIYVNPLSIDELSEAMLTTISNNEIQGNLTKNTTNNIDTALLKLEEAFLSIRKARKLWGVQYKL